jgi:SAM-dependent MidA family methyltransferase
MYIAQQWKKAAPGQTPWGRMGPPACGPAGWAGSGDNPGIAQGAGSGGRPRESDKMESSESLPGALTSHIQQAIAAQGGWLPFDRFMALALYQPGLGYYANDRAKFGQMPQSGSDFVTAPELSPVFGQLLAVQLAEALARTGTDEVWEFGAGTGALALQLLQALQALGVQIRRYTIVDLSGTLRARQQATLSEFAGLVHWVDQLPAQFSGVVVGNEVLDAMPVQLLQRSQGRWHERGVVAEGAGFAWQDRLSDLRPPMEIEGEHDYLTEIHPQGEAFIRTLGERLARGAAFFIDYGFGESEYYHPQRHMGTLVCHYQHQVDSDPLDKVGLKDITAHVNFTGTAVAAQDAGFELLGYTTQAHFLINCGLQQKLEQLTLAQRAPALKLMLEHEMGELFKVIGLVKGVEDWEAWNACGFAQGDRMHRL